jgi:hypothetical protein
MRIAMSPCPSVPSVVNCVERRNSVSRGKTFIVPLVISRWCLSFARLGTFEPRQRATAWVLLTRVGNIKTDPTISRAALREGL